jgi:hypothetical protein
LRQLPLVVRAPFSSAMSDTLLLPVAILALGFVSVLFFALPRHLAARGEQPGDATAARTPATSPALDPR